MRTPFIAGNWKMNKSPDAAVAFVREIAPLLDAIDGIDSAVCPRGAVPSTHFIHSALIR